MIIKLKKKRKLYIVNVLEKMLFYEIKNIKKIKNNNIIMKREKTNPLM